MGFLSASLNLLGCDVDLPVPSSGREKRSGFKVIILDYISIFTVFLNFFLEIIFSCFVAILKFLVSVDSDKSFGYSFCCISDLKVQPLQLYPIKGFLKMKFLYMQIMTRGSSSINIRLSEKFYTEITKTCSR